MFLTHPFPVIPTYETKESDTIETSIKEQIFINITLKFTAADFSGWNSTVFVRNN